MLGTRTKNTNVGNVTNPGKAANGTDYQYISRKFDIVYINISVLKIL